MFINSKVYLDKNITQAKRDAQDYTVTLSPKFTINGVVHQAIIDGHHSWAAARADGVEPEFIVATVQDDPRIALINHSVEEYLEACRGDSCWIDVDSGIAIATSEQGLQMNLPLTYFLFSMVITYFFGPWAILLLIPGWYHIYFEYDD